MSSQALLLAVLVVLVLVILAWQAHKRGYMPEGFLGDPLMDEERAEEQQAVIEEFRKPARGDEHLASHVVRGATGMTPDQLQAAEMSMWHPEHNRTPGDPTGPSTDAYFGDYSDNLAGRVVDERAQANHCKWAEEVAPFSQTTARNIDNLDEAVYVNARNGRGLMTFRPDLPAQGPNSLFVTEADHVNAMQNSKSSFFRGVYHRAADCSAM